MRWTSTVEDQPGDGADADALGDLGQSVHGLDADYGMTRAAPFGAPGRRVQTDKPRSTVGRRRMHGRVPRWRQMR